MEQPNTNGEQSEQIGQTVQATSNHSHLFLAVGVGIIAILAVVFVLWASKFTVPDLDQYVPEENKNSPIVESESVATTSVTYFTSIKQSDKKVISKTDYRGHIDIYNVGKINDGKYKDSFITLAEYVQEEDEGFYGRYHYGFYITDKAGNPIAWDPNYFNILYFDPKIDPATDNYVKNLQSISGAELIGLTEINKTSLSFLTPEFSTERPVNITTKNPLELFSLRYNVHDTKILNLDASSPATYTQSGFPIIKKTLAKTDNAGPFSQTKYYVVLPFGKSIELSPTLTFVDPNEVPEIAWRVGTKLVASYRYGEYAYGIEDCFDGISSSQLEKAFTTTGVTQTAEYVYEPLYEIKAEVYPSVYKCLHEKTKRYDYNPDTQKGEYIDTISYEEFITTHPLFFWKHPIGEYITFVRSDVVPAAEKAKPVIYLYPERNTRVSVKVDPVGGFTVTIPEYGNGWTVDATPEGKITNLADAKTYPYLFWEGGKDGAVRTPKEGFVIAKENMEKELDQKLSQFNLNEQERKDFLEFWVPKLSEAPYYFITFISRSEIDRVAPLTISPKPQNTIRVLMDYRPLNEPVEVSPLEIPSTKRDGFTAVEWGGILH